MSEKTNGTTIVLSLSGLMARLVAGDVQIEDLDKNTLYYLGCTHAVALDAMNVDPEYVEGTDPEKRDQRREIYGRLQPVLEEAFEDLRLVARNRAEDQSSYEGLNALLEMNWWEDLPLESVDASNRRHYNLQTAREVLEAADYRVID